MRSEIINQIINELVKNSNSKDQKTSQRFFKEEVKTHGVKSAVVKQISNKYFLKIKDLDKKEIFLLCEELLKTGYNQEAKIAFDWSYKIRKQFVETDFNIFEKWIEKYITNWGSCDDFCTHPFGFFVYKYPEFLPKTKAWGKSQNRWLKRASAVILIYSVRRGNCFKNAIEISSILLNDKDDLVQKGYGWLLKEASKRNQKEVFNFINQNKAVMPRTALRYAIEKMPSPMRAIAMKR